MGVLLGLADWRRDVACLFEHLRLHGEKYPGVEYTLSFPRIRPVADDERAYFEVSGPGHGKDHVRCQAALSPRGINLSTRESAEFRDHVVEFGVTKISAGSLTSVGGYSDPAGEALPGRAVPGT